MIPPTETVKQDVRAPYCNLRIESGSDGKICAELKIRRGLGLQAVSASHALPLEFDCRRADCGICMIQVVEGSENLSPQTFAETDFLAAMGALPQERLACQCRIMGDVVLRLPDIDI